MAKKRTCPTTEEFKKFLKLNPEAKNKDIAAYFGIATTTAAKLKSQIKSGTRPDYSDARAKLVEKTKELTPEDPDWWKYSVKRGGQLCTFDASKDLWLIRPEVQDAMLNLKNKYPKQHPAVKSQITAFYDQFRHHSSPDMTLEEFSAVIRGLKAMMKVEPIDVQARYGNKPTHVVSKKQS